MKIKIMAYIILLFITVAIPGYTEEDVGKWIGYIYGYTNENGSCDITPSTIMSDDEWIYTINYDLDGDSCQVIARFRIRNNGLFSSKTLDAAIFKYLIPLDSIDNAAFVDAIGRIPTIAIFKEGMPESDYDIEFGKIISKLSECVHSNQDIERYEYRFPNDARLWIDKDKYLDIPGGETLFCITVSVWYN